MHPSTQAQNLAPSVATATKPNWDLASRQLSLNGRLLKFFRRKAPIQILILDALQAEGWPPRIADPLKSFHEREGHKALRNAVANLNRLLSNPQVRFFTEEHDEYVGWQLLIEAK